MKKTLLFLATVLFSAQLWAAPVITAITVSATTPTTATITWTTGAGASSQVLYGIGNILSQTPVDGTLVTSHSVTVSLLTAGPVYSFAVVSQDSTGSTTSATNTFALCGGRSNTQVTGTINVAYEYGLYTLALVNDSGSGATPTVCGAAVTTPASGTLDLHGNLTVAVPDSNLIVPGPSRWQVSVTSFAGTGGAIGAFNFTTKITGNSQDLTSLLQSGASGQLQHVIYDPATTSFNPPITGSGTVTNVNATTNAAWLTIGGVPITGGGTITINATPALTANQFVATPNGSTGPAGLRGIVGADVPAINLASSVNGGVTGNLPVANLDSGTNAGVTNAVWCGTAHWCVPPGTGTVSSVGLSLPAALFSIANSPVTTSGTLTGSFASIAAHNFLGNCTSGSATAGLCHPAVTDITGAAPLASPTFTGTVAISGISDGCGQFASGVLASTGVACGSGGGGASITVNGGSTLTSPVNFQNGSAVTGITINFSNPSGSNVAAAISGTLTNAGLANSAITINGTSVSLGGTRTLTLASADFINQGTTTTLLHGNAAGNPSFGAVGLTTDVSGILPGANGGTGNGFFAVTGPATSLKTFTFPNASSTVLTSNAAVTVPQGGTGVATLTAHGVLLGEGASNITASAAGALDAVLVGQGASADPAFQAVNDCTGTGKALTRDNTAHSFGCNTISATGTVNSATINQIAIYATTGTAVSGDSIFTDDGNVLTYTGAGGLALTSASAGLVSLGQGTAQGLGTNAVGLTSPTGVTSWNLLFAAAAGSGYMKGSNASNIVTQTFEANIDLTADVGATILPVANGGTGKATLTNHGLLVGATTSPLNQVAPGSSNLAVLVGNGGGTDPSFTSNPVLGGPTSGGAGTGSLGLSGLTSGTVTIQPQSVAGTYNFNLPIAAGNAGEVLTSQAGGSTAETWTRFWATNAQTSTYQVLVADFASCKTIPVASGTFTITLVASGSQPAAGQCIRVINYGSGVVTVARSGQQINGSNTSQTIAAGSASAPNGLEIYSDGTNYVAQPYSGSASGVTSIATTSPITGGTITTTGTIACATCSVTGNTIDQNNAATTSAQLASTITNETGTGLLVFATNPVLTTPNLGTPSAVTLTNATGLPCAAEPAFTGDITTSAGACATTLATVNSNVGSFTNANITVNGKGLVTAASNGAGAAGASLLVSTTDAGPNNTATETSLIGTVSTGSKTIAANTLGNNAVTFYIGGFMSTPLTPDSLTVKFYLDATVICTATYTPIASLTNGVFRLTGRLFARGTGAGGTTVIDSLFENTGTALTPNETTCGTVGTPVSIDFTASHVLDVKAKWNAAQSGELIKGSGIDAYIGGAPVTSVAGDGVVHSSTPQTGAAVLSLVNAAANTVLGNATGSSAAPTYTTNPSVATVTASGQIAAAGYKDTSIGYLATAMTQQTTATCTNITNMTWTIAASKNYRLSCMVPVTGVASATLAYCVNGPGTPTSVTIGGFSTGSTVTSYAGLESINQTAWQVKTGTVAIGANTRVSHLDIAIQNGSTASGTALTVQTAANGTNGITVDADAVCTLTQVN